jgi:antitoxin ParD1/3/4
MATMNISLPDALKEYVESCVAEGRFSNASDYVRDLIRSEQKNKAYAAYLKEAINEGPASGFSNASIDEVFSTAMSGVEAKAQK